MKIEIKDLHHTYASGEEALKGINAVFEGNEPVAIIGQNGAGKTTLVKHFNGILRPTSGDVLLDGESIMSRTTAKWARDVGYVFQNPDDQLFLESVRKEFEFGPSKIGMPTEKMASQLKFVSELCGLEKELDTHPFNLTSTQKKFCTIGSIIMMDPQVLIFDEPTCGQDVRGTERLCNIIKTLREMGKLCITISHDMKFVVKNFSRVVVLCKGKVIMDGKAEEVFSRPEELSKTFVTPPPITRVAQRAGLDGTVFTIDSFMNSFRSKVKGAVKE